MARTILLVCWLAGAGAARYDPLTIGGEWLIGGYKAVLSPLQGPNTCNFFPTCSQFTKAAIQSQGFVPGLLIGADRLMRCNTVAWSYYDSYYVGDVVSGRMPDPVENHVAWLSPTDEPGLRVPAQPVPLTEARDRSLTRVSPSLGFADYLYSSGEYEQAAAEYLRVRFSFGSSGLSGYAGLMAGESYLQAGEVARARHAYQDLVLPRVREFRQYGLARTFFAEARYAEARTSLGSIRSAPLSGQAKALAGWTFFRQRRFADGASSLAASASDEPSRHLSTMDGHDLPRRSRLASSLLSAIVPGAGQLYSGRAGDGAYSFLSVAGTGLVTWWFAAEPATRDRTRVKVSIFGVLTALFYAGNVYGANVAARDYNLLQERRYVQRADSLFRLIPLEPDYTGLLDSACSDTARPGRE